MNYKLLIDITDYIILYPIKWYNFIKRVISFSTIYNNIIIVAKKTITDYKVIEEVFKILDDNNVLKEISENKDFLIYYFNKEVDINLFSKWLNLISLRGAVDVFGEVKCEHPLSDEFFMVIRNKKIIINDNILDDENIYITLKKTKKVNAINYNYSYFTFKNDLVKMISKY